MLHTVVDTELGSNWHATTVPVRPHPAAPGQNVAVLIHRPGTLGPKAVPSPVPAPSHAGAAVADVAAAGPHILASRAAAGAEESTSKGATEGATARVAEGTLAAGPGGPGAGQAAGNVGQPDQAGEPAGAHGGGVFDATAGDVGHHFPTVCGERAVLYIHGFQDYFFHPHLARAWEKAGYTFFALDLRGNGRAWDGTGEIGQVDHLRAYGDDLMRSIHLIRSAGAKRVVINGHSTGGLLAAVWTHAFPEAVDALVLNSPWLDLAGPLAARLPARAVAKAAAAINRSALLATLPGYFAAGLHYSTGGEFHFSLARKIITGAAVRAGFLSSVIAAQAAVARGLNLPVPALVCHSSRSQLALGWGHDAMLRAAKSDSDVVLDVKRIAARTPSLGPYAERAVIVDGKHDLALSKPAAREEYFRTISLWTDKALEQFPPSGRGSAHKQRDRLS
ncbi:MAG: alpha/beta hydrolase [Buchananella hordeovulneris]|nr:alpha/beta hydrolase [Buchananella hordeovulneris]